MVSMTALHSLTAELHAGFLTLAFVCIMMVAVAQVVVRLREKRWMPQSFVNLAIRIRGYAEAAGYMGAALGIIGLLLSAYTGMYAWPQDVLLDSPIIRNKIMFTVFSTVMWGGVLFIRARFGRGLWTCPMMAAVYVGLAFVAFGVLGMTGSMGAHLTVHESVLDPFWNFIGMRVESPITLGPGVAETIAIICGIVFVLSLAVARRYDLFSVKLEPAVCQKMFKWDEPRIQETIPPSK
jgi:hypothetical protein